jgi:hypothetical protein
MKTLYFITILSVVSCLNEVSQLGKEAKYVSIRKFIKCQLSLQKICFNLIGC